VQEQLDAVEAAKFAALPQWKQDKISAKKLAEGEAQAMANEQNKVPMWKRKVQENKKITKQLSAAALVNSTPRAASGSLTGSAWGVELKGIPKSAPVLDRLEVEYAFSDRNLHSRRAIEFHAFVPLETSRRVTNGIPLGGHSSYRLPL
jgi:hypothetical protein